MPSSLCPALLGHQLPPRIPVVDTLVACDKLPPLRPLSILSSETASRPNPRRRARTARRVQYPFMSAASGGGCLTASSGGPGQACL
jgi:hypothetical protein